VYTDDSILLGPDQGELEYLIKKISNKFKIQEEGNLGEYLGIQITKQDDYNLTMTQPQLVDFILQDSNLHQQYVKGRTTPALSTVLIRQDKIGAPFDHSFHYKTAMAS
jgi:hypothetical protein